MQLPCVCRVQEVSSRQKVFSLEKRLEKPPKNVFSHIQKTCSWTIKHICKVRSAYVYVNENLDECVKDDMCTPMYMLVSPATCVVLAALRLNSS